MSAVAVNVRVCSAKNAPSSKKRSVYVRLSLGNTIAHTSAKKHAGSSLFWNSSYGFVTSSDSAETIEVQLRCKEGLLLSAKDSLIGCAHVEVPACGEGLADVWIDLDGDSSAAVHLCLQAERLGKRSVTDIVEQRGSRRSTRASGRLSTRLRASTAAASSDLLLSTFFGKASEVSLNEIITSLDDAKAIIATFSDAPLSKGSSKQLHALQGIKKELIEIQEQIERLSNISDIWRSELESLVLLYLGDVYELLSFMASSRTPSLNRKSSSDSYSSWTVGKAPVSLSSSGDDEDGRESSEEEESAAVEFDAIIEDENDLGEFGSQVKTFALSSTTAFDALTDTGIAVEITKPGIPRTNPKCVGDHMVVSVVGFVLHQETKKLVSFTRRDSVAVALSDESDEDELVEASVVPLPKGFYKTLPQLTSRCQFRIVLAGKEGFGATGFGEIVPPDATLVYEGRVVGDVVDKRGELVSAAASTRTPTRPRADPPPRVVSNPPPPRVVSNPSYATSRRTRVPSLNSFLRQHNLLAYARVLRERAGCRCAKDLAKVSNEYFLSGYDQRNFKRALAALSSRGTSNNSDKRDSTATEDSLDELL